jgi:predicted aspartyl protease
VIVVQARSKLGQLILVGAKIDGRRVNVILDTGAELSIGNMALFRQLKQERLVIAPHPTTITSVTGMSIAAQYTVVRRITIDTIELENVPMVFLDAAPFAELGLADRPAMLLGMTMLRMFDRVAIDFGNRHVGFALPQGNRNRAPATNMMARL